MFGAPKKDENGRRLRRKEGQSTNEPRANSLNHLPKDDQHGLETKIKSSPVKRTRNRQAHHDNKQPEIRGGGGGLPDRDHCELLPPITTTIPIITANQTRSAPSCSTSGNNSLFSPFLSHSLIHSLSDTVCVCVIVIVIVCPWLIRTHTGHWLATTVISIHSI